MEMTADIFWDTFLTTEGLFDVISNLYIDVAVEMVACNLEIETDHLLGIKSDSHGKRGEDLYYIDGIRDIWNNAEYYKWLYKILDDEKSKEILLAIIRYRIVPIEEFLEAYLDKQNQEIIELIIGSGENLKEQSSLKDAIKFVIDESELIKKDKPSISICVDKNYSDIWEVPKLLNIMNTTYKYSLNLYNCNNRVRIILNAYEPKVQIKEEKPYYIKKVIAMAPYERGWSNLELIKDCGLIPYLLHKNYNCEVHMVGAPGESLTNRELVPGVIDDILPDTSMRAKVNYMLQNGKDCDLLVLRGPYEVYYDVVKAYRRINKDGKIFLPLDANGYWMDKIQWTDEEFTKLLDNCDLITTSCTAMASHLSKKWPWNIEVLTNGFYNVYGIQRLKKEDIAKKEKIILTVSRLGTWQKKTNILLSAFLNLSVKLPEWKLVLVGSIEKDFLPVIEQMYKDYPWVKERIEFAGVVYDKNELYNYYKRARVFALTSAVEGGAPNVIAEALNFGCSIVTTRIDAWEDIVDNERCGYAAEIGDSVDIGNKLIKICTNPNWMKLCEASLDNAEKRYNMEKNVTWLHDRLVGKNNG